MSSLTQTASAPTVSGSTRDVLEEHRRSGRLLTTGCAPAGTRPRDLRSSFITVQVYAGVPLTTIAKQCGTGVAMIEKPLRRNGRELGRPAGRR
ncbi:MAG: hypothetical protein ACTHQQ_17455 [Solirubrobacteraceae bacterium]